MSSINHIRAKQFIEASPRRHSIKVTVGMLTTLIETALGKRNLVVDLTFSEMKFTNGDLWKIQQLMRDKWHFHLEVYGFDTIKDLERIITGNFQ